MILKLLKKEVFIRFVLIKLLIKLRIKIMEKMVEILLMYLNCLSLVYKVQGIWCKRKLIEHGLLKSQLNNDLINLWFALIRILLQIMLIN